MQSNLADHTHLGATRPTQTVCLSQLSPGANLCAWSLRQWVVSNHLGRCTGCDLFHAHRDMSCTAAIIHLQQFMSLLAREATRRIEVRHLGIEALSHDEFILLRLIALAGHGRRPRYAGHLARGLVPERASAQLRTYAQGYFTQLQASGLTLSGWLETELVTQVH